MIWLLKKLRDWFRSRSKHWFRCEGCKALIYKHGNEGYFSRMDDNGWKGWCRTCAKNDPDIHNILLKMEEMSTFKQRVAEKISKGISSNQSEGADK